MSYLIILSIVSLNEPTKDCGFKYFLSNKKDLDKKIKSIKDEVIKENTIGFENYESDEKCPYYDGYLAPNFEKYKRIEGQFVPLGDAETFLIENHTSYYIAYSITVRNLDEDNEFQFYEH